ncbi:ANTAR domain-containing response regulator [Streptomyces albus]|uniref:ANTAR domain-containing response regulator n=1 Tax=Streptomyces albus TaxID=1888 RepID=UPI00099DC694|nr:GAF and ANTAR domain-containing protein [Streptomyces albus]
MAEYRGAGPDPAPDTVTDAAPEATADAVTDASEAGLARLAERAAACHPWCCGAGATAFPVSRLSGAREAAAAFAVAPLRTAVTHPDLTPLVTVQRETGEGPVPAVLETGRPAVSEDLLYDERWPRYRARALEAGVRSSTTLPFRREDLLVTLTVYGFRPGLLVDPAHGVTALLGDLATSEIVRGMEQRRLHAEIDQLGTALRARPVVDQACGIIMHVLGCDAGTAFGLLRSTSQRTNQKLSDLAAALVRSRGRGAEAEILRLAGGRPAARRERPRSGRDRRP